MIFLDEDPIEWAKEKKIDIEAIPCIKCGKSFTPNLPFITDNFYGLACTEHECGKRYQAMIYVYRSELKNLEASRALRSIVESLDSRKSKKEKTPKLTLVT